jgi:hypothetical protein
MNSFKSARGQATVLTVVFLTALLGMAALVLDVGSWFRAHRDTQATADAAALAGAQALPEDPGTANALALKYAGANGGGLAAGDVAVSTDIVANDTISVHVKRDAPGFFSKLFGVNVVSVGATAKARAENVGAARYVAPIAVFYKHEKLYGGPGGKPQFGSPTELDLADLHKPGSGDAAGAFGLIDLDPNDNGSAGSGVLEDWILHGYSDAMPLGDYHSVPSAKFNSSQVKEGLDIRTGDVLLFPVYDRLTGPGDNAIFHVIGWVGFRVTGYDAHGSSGAVYGSFTRFIAEGLQSEDPSQPDYGVRTIQLVQ